jgi:hypothetical protein
VKGEPLPKNSRSLEPAETDAVFEGKTRGREELRPGEIKGMMADSMEDPPSPPIRKSVVDEVQHKLPKRGLWSLEPLRRKGAGLFAFAASLFIAAATYREILLREGLGSVQDRGDARSQLEDHPGGSFQDLPVDELLRALGSDDARVRASSTEALLKLGERIRARLEEAVRSGADTEVRERLKDILARLDKAAATEKVRRTIQDHSGFLGDTGVFWVDREAFELLSQEENIPETLRPALVTSDHPMVALAEVSGGRVQASDAMLLSLKDAVAKQGRVQVYHYRRYVYDFSAINTSEHWAWSVMYFHQFSDVWFRKVRKPQATELFRLWPRLRSAAVAFFVLPQSDEVSVGELLEQNGMTTADLEGGKALFRGLAKALVHDRADLRAAAAHLLRHYFTLESAALAQGALDDKEPMVREAARQALTHIAKAPQGTAAEVRRWWEALREGERLARLHKFTRTLTPDGRLGPGSFEPADGDPSGLCCEEGPEATMGPGPRK